MGKRETKRLNPLAIRSAKTKPGYHPDGNGLYLQVSPTGSTSWVLRYNLNKRAREMGLGSTENWTLAEAREQVRKYHQLLAEGIDPIESRRAERNRNLHAIAQQRTFEQCAREYHALHAAGWKNAKHSNQWINTLITHAFPVFGKRDVSSIGKTDILRALEPIWAIKPETASRVRQRIRAVLDWAAARDYRTGHDPHLWDQINRSLPKTKDIKKPRHFAACPYIRIQEVMQSVWQSGASDTVKRALEFLVLTAARSGEVRNAKWAEVDLQGKRWILPPERMKAGREHRVPLSERAMEVLVAQRSVSGKSDLVFPNERGAPYSDMTLTMLLRRQGHDFTVHGFRSSFRDWSAEQTNYPREVCEAALAHTLGNDTEAAYFRSDLFEKRRQLMEAWSLYCASEPAPSHLAAVASQ